MNFDTKEIFEIKSEQEFTIKALALFQFQFEHNPVYQEFCNHLKIKPRDVTCIEKIPFLPIQLFKMKEVLVRSTSVKQIFTSSGTTGSTTSKHFVSDISLYEESYLKAFELFYGPITDYCILGLLPSYLERKGSSLIYMVADLIKKSGHPDSGFYLTNTEDLVAKLQSLESKKTKTLLIGVSFALLDLQGAINFPLKRTIVMETGGMKGRRKEIIRNELHNELKNLFGVAHVHSEYGMTELLSQAYSKKEGLFQCPPWMRVFIRDPEDPFTFQKIGKSGGLNIIDLANVYSCPFIATQDLGRCYEDGSFEVLGRFDHSDIRGCNLMAV